MISTTGFLVIALAIVSSPPTILGAEDDVGNSTTTTLKPPTTAPSTVAPTNATTAAPTPSTTPGSTTKAPTTVAPTTAAPTTAAPTTAPPHPKEYMWTVKDPKTGVTCIIAELKIQLDIPYTNMSNKVEMAHVKVPGNATGTGSCDSKNLNVKQTLLLQWGQDNATSNVTLVFAANSTTKQFWLDSVSAEIATDNKTFPRLRPSLKVVKLSNDSKHFMTPMDNSYSCPTIINVPGKLEPAVLNHTGYITFDHFQLQAFKNSSTNGFSTAVYCEGDNMPDLVPILVGCTLVGLVVIVLFVYLWGRRRSQQRGYLSM